MKDTSFSIALIIIFGLSGLALLLAGWSFPFQHTGQVTVWIGGGLGLGFALVRVWLLVHERFNQQKAPAPVEVHNGDRP